MVYQNAFEKYLLTLSIMFGVYLDFDISQRKPLKLHLLSYI